MIATPIGVALALGLARWRGRGSGASNFLMLLPLVTPEIVLATGNRADVLGNLVLEARAEKWRPWRAYAALHLWLKHDERH